MSLDEIIEGIRTLTDADFNRLSDEMFTMRREREARDQVEAGQAQLVAELQDAGKLDKPDAATAEQAQEHADTVPEWQDPGTDHSRMYHRGDVVRYGDKIVRSTHPGLNHWEPGTLAFDGRIWEIIGTVDEPTGAEGQDTGTDIAPEGDTTPTDEPGTPEWAPGLNVKPGERYQFQDATYEVIQGHTSAAHWPPNAVPALYRKV